MADEPIRRRFVDLPHGQVHYRTCGQGAPLLLLHSSPGSSRQLERMIAALADRRQVFAPDTPGNGDSAPLGPGGHAITDLAAAMLAFMDAAGIATADVHGTHTGAAIAAELAILAPSRVRTVALDGVSVLAGAQLDDFLARYAPPFVPDHEGSHLARAYQFCRDQFLFFPWYDRTRAARRDCGLPSPEDLDALVIELLKSGRSYSANYHAAFRWYAAVRLPLVSCPLLLMASAADPLFEATRAVAGDRYRFQPLPRFDAADYADVRGRALATLFDEGS